MQKKLNSNEAKTKGPHLLMALIVQSQSRMASKVAKKFDSKSKAFSKLTEYKYNQDTFIEEGTCWLCNVIFEVGQPWLLKWVLQHKEIYSGVLHGLGNDDDDENFIYVLSTL